MNETSKFTAVEVLGQLLSIGVTNNTLSPQTWLARTVSSMKDDDFIEVLSHAENGVSVAAFFVDILSPEVHREALSEMFEGSWLTKSVRVAHALRVIMRCRINIEQDLFNRMLNNHLEFNKSFIYDTEVARYCEYRGWNMPLLTR